MASVCFYLDARELSLLYGDVGFYLRRECSVNAAGYASGGGVLKDGAACLALGSGHHFSHCSSSIETNFSAAGDSEAPLR